MPKQHHTVIFVPHAHAKLRKWRVTNLQIGLVTGASSSSPSPPRSSSGPTSPPRSTRSRSPACGREREAPRGQPGVRVEHPQAAGPAQRPMRTAPGSSPSWPGSRPSATEPRPASAAALRLDAVDGGRRDRRRGPARAWQGRLRQIDGDPEGRRDPAPPAGALDLPDPGHHAGQGHPHQRLRLPQRPADPRPRRPPGRRHRRRAGPARARHRRRHRDPRRHASAPWARRSTSPTASASPPATATSPRSRSGPASGSSAATSSATSATPAAPPATTSTTRCAQDGQPVNPAGLHPRRAAASAADAAPGRFRMPASSGA